MAETISLTELVAAGSDLSEEVTKAVEALREGRLIIAPIEHAYVFIADAFNHGTVKKMHILRGDALGVAAQVIVGDVKTATGITNEFGPTTQSICEKLS